MRTHPPKRAAYSLLEVLVVMAVVGLFLAMGTALLYGYTKLNTASAWNLDSLTQGRDMAEAWRRDVRLAKAAPQSAKEEMVLELPGETVTWKMRDNRMVRVVAGQKNARDWVLGPGKNWVEFAPGNQGSLVVLRHGEERVNGRHVRGEYTALRGGDLP
jgi:prepilin-type N-terminal cleavage/methylation domain-containing protein